LARPAKTRKWSIPEADVGLISGGIRNDEHRRLAQEMRRKCKTLIALGSCACYGGVPALANLYSTEELLTKVYRESVSTELMESRATMFPR
jgi:F420-non-reducing hydrogenase small subunit